MEYSLENLNKLANLKSLTIKDLVNTLNLSGLEVEEILTEKLEGKNYSENTKIVLKIPANREDLLNEELFIKELSTLFLIDTYQIWKIYENNYKFLLKQKYLEYNHYKTYLIESSYPDILNYSIGLKNVKNIVSPIWIQEKLLNRGIKPTECLENILNLTMLEWGQSINLINDSFTLNNNNELFEISRLDKSETFINKEEKNFLLNKGTIVLKRNNKIYSVLGIINYSAEKERENFILEAIFYDINENPLSLNDLNTKISLRYLRKIFVEKFRSSFQRLLTLLEIVTFCNLESLKYISKTKFTELETYKLLVLEKDYFKKFLNIINYDKKIFEKAGLTVVCETKNKLYFRIPKVRSDLQRPVDLIEEYSRFVGYKNFPEFRPSKNLVYSTKIAKNSKFIKQFFLTNHFNEIFCNSICSEESKEVVSVKLSNPLNQELSLLRNVLIPNLVQIMEKNGRSSNNLLRFFEIGRIFERKNGKISEEDHVAGVFQFNSVDSNNQSEWFEAKGFIENFLSNFQYDSLYFKPIKTENKFYHPTKSIEIKDKEFTLGYFCELHPRIAQNVNIKRKIYLFEFNLKFLNTKRLKTKIVLYKEYSKYPIITKDVSIKVNNKLSFSELKKFIKENTKNLKLIEFFDLYFENKEHKNINLGLRFIFQSYINTLTTEFIEEELKRIVLLIENKFLTSFPSGI